MEYVFFQEPFDEYCEVSIPEWYTRNHYKFILGLLYERRVPITDVDIVNNDVNFIFNLKYRNDVLFVLHLLRNHYKGIKRLNKIFERSNCDEQARIKRNPSYREQDLQTH